MRSRMLRTGAAAVLCVGLGGCWLAPGQGPDRRAHNPFETALTTANVATLAEAWSTDTGDRAVGPPVVSPGGGVHARAGNTLVTLAAGTGAPRWSYAGFGPDFRQMSDPIVRGDEVVVGSGIGNLGGNWETVALDAAGGTARTLPVAGLVGGLRGSTVATRSYAFGSGTPVLSTIGLRDVDTGAGWSGALAISSSGSAASAATVAPAGMWHTGSGILDAAPMPTPRAGYGVRFFTSARPADCAPAGGTYPYFPCPHWATPVDGVPTEPVATGSSVVVGTGAGTVYAVEVAGGAVQWSRAVGGPVEAAPAADGERIYVATAAGDLMALDPASGETEWRATGLGTLSVQPAVAGGVVYVGGEDGTVRAFAAAGCGAATCAPLWEDDTGDSAITGAPAVSSGRLLAGTADGRVVAWTAGSPPGGA